MNIVLVIPTSGVENGQPKEWFAQRLDAAIDYYNQNLDHSITFIVSGRWNSAEAEYPQSEAAVARQYITSRIPNAHVIKEDISLETGGNIAFTKPIVKAYNPDLVVIFCSQVHRMRLEYFVSKIYDPTWNVEFVEIHDSLSENPRAQAKEPKALSMFKKLFDTLEPGDDSTARNILLYKTPFYYRALINDIQFFDEYWPGGLADFQEKRLSIDNK